MKPIITLTTDFGADDPWVALMKGAILSINPDVTIIDITHNIPPQDIAQAMICVSCFGDTFPENTIHCVVVDPGVGSSREAIIVATERYFYVGPDNAVFSMLDSGVKKVVKITNEKYFRPKVSTTFHGRDVFAPVAAHLTLLPMEEFGPVVDDYHRQAISEPLVSETGMIGGEVIYFDRFGNAFTNITVHHLRRLAKNFPGGRAEIRAGERTINALSASYSATPPESLGAIVNGFGYLELFTPNGNARETFSIGKGDNVEVLFHSGSA